MSFGRLTCSFVYSGLSIGSGSLGGSLYLNFIFSALMEIPGNLFAMFMMKRPAWGRRWTNVISFAIGNCMCGYGR
eukprot:m.245244 g.245244  ORF g.245244 m.245244 type:complete len:75 (-) comp10957_c0_seq4:835-1059(-)